MEGFKKIDLSSESKNEVINSGKKPKIPKKFLTIFLVFIILLAVSSIFTIILPAQRTYKSAMKTYEQTKKTLDAVKKQNVELASTELEKTKKDLVETQKNLNALSFLKYVPILGGYYNDADHLAKAGYHSLNAATVLVDSVKPYADILGLKGQGSFVMGSAEQRIQTAIMTMGKITPRIDDVSDTFILAKKEIDAVDPNHYPSILGGDKIKKNLIKLKETTDQGATFVDQARPLIKVMPSLLGESKEKKYLILFQNDKELRATGGFITAYAIFRIDKGVIHVERSDDIYNLDNAVANKPKAPEPILKYLPKVYSLNLRDSNLSPDFEESMKTFNSMYQKIPGRVDIDGIIAIDTHVLVSTIKILNDEVQAAGITFTTKEDKRCNCPQVIYTLEDNISRPVNYVKSGRKDLLGALLYAIMEKALKSSPKLYWGPLFQDMIAETAQKHILFDINDKNAQDGIVALNAAGKIKTFDGDYLHINDTNFAGAKSNMYVKQNVEQSYDVKSDGSIVKTVTINYKNPYPPSDCNLERGGLCLNADLRNWLRIYVPKGSELIDSKGSEVKVSTYEELGKTVFEGFFIVRPQGSAKFTISYRLPFKLAKGSSLPVLVQKQPGTDKNGYETKVNGKKAEKFDLVTDKELKLANF
ncbi:MAG: hypothetical protein A3H79_00960 [Candidatus Levybacteria bacterium RIFCSPLOWO2_02_FULL_36_8b]|nr:MAG: hypothetical protein A3H79_00960 [Candidatus Levybacteria bacterium RIFCSPLOWO2_02_FULL_36_8b]